MLRVHLLGTALLGLIVYSSAAVARGPAATVRFRAGRVVADGAEVLAQPDGGRYVPGPLSDTQAMSAPAAGAAQVKARLLEPIGEVGTLSLWIKPAADYRNGDGQPSERHQILHIRGLGGFEFRQASDACLLMWDWERPTIKGTDGIYSYIPELPAREWYHLLVTWDAARGILNYFVNGTPMRVPGTVVTPWKLEPQTEVTLSADGFSVAELRLEPECLTAQQALERVPPAFRGRGAALFGAGPVPLSASLDSRKGRLLYESKLASPAQIGGWVMEGPGVLKFADGWLEMSSQMVDGKPKGHIVHWCPRDFPDRFVAEWECQVTSEFGLNIIFFAAKGVGGEDIFDPKLPPRNGTFRQYTSEAIVSYHISYYADTPDTPGRSTSNLRKNNHFYLVANGPPGIPAGSNRVHSIRLIKDGAHVQCQVDGRVIIDYTDDGKRYGPVHGGGKIGFRQMQWSVTRYRNFRVWVLAR